MSLVDTTDALALALESSGLAESGRANLLETFGPSFVAVRTLIAESAGIVVTDATQLTEMKAARAARLKIKDARVEVEKLRKSTKDESLRFGQSVDKVAKMIAVQCEAEERRLEEAEKFAERVEAERKAALLKSRREALTPFVPDVSIYPLGEMTEAAWGQLLTGSRSAFEAAAEAARKAEADRLAAIEAQKAEDARIRAENARLAKEAAERDAAAKAEREKAAAELKAAQDKADAERRAREAVERKAAEERAAAERAEAARKAEEARKVAEAKRAADAAAKAPDADKLSAFVKSIMDMPLPEMATPAGSRAVDQVKVARGRFFREFVDIDTALRAL